MRSFLVSFRATGKGVDIVGDVIADLPDEGRLNKAFIDSIREDIKSGFNAKFAERKSFIDSIVTHTAAPTQDSKLLSVDQVVILSFLHLEA